MRLGDVVEATQLPASLPLAIATRSGSGRSEAYTRGTWPGGSGVATSDRFYAASLSKQVTAAAVAVLVREGLLDPDAAIAQQLQELPRWAERVTIRQLLHHLGGLPPAGSLEIGLGNDWTNGFAIQAARRLPSVHAGQRYDYSNVGYVILARIVERRVDMPFAEAVATLVIRPLGLKSMAFETDISGFPQTTLMGPSLPLSNGDGGLWTTADAFATWLDLQNRDALGVADLVQSAGRLADGSVTDYGWGIGIRQFRGCPLYIHGGDWRGATAKAVRSPALGLSVVALSAGAAQEELGALVDAALNALADVEARS